MSDIIPDEILNDPEKYYDLNQRFLTELRNKRKIRVNADGSVDTSADKSAILSLAINKIPHARIPGAYVTVPTELRIMCISTFAILTHLSARGVLTQINPETYSGLIPAVNVPIAKLNIEELRKVINYYIINGVPNSNETPVEAIKKIIKDQAQKVGITKVLFKFTSIQTTDQILENTLVDVTSEWKYLVNQIKDINISVVITFAISIMMHAKKVVDVSKDVIYHIRNIAYSMTKSNNRKRDRSVSSDATVWSVVQNVVLTVVNIITTIPDTILSKVMANMSPQELDMFSKATRQRQFKLFTDKLFVVVKDYVTNTKFSNPALTEFIKMNWIFQYREPLTIKRHPRPENEKDDAKCNQEIQEIQEI